MEGLLKIKINTKLLKCRFFLEELISVSLFIPFLSRVQVIHSPFKSGMCSHKLKHFPAFKCIIIFFVEINESEFNIR
jgi:hypothetical protein